MNKELLDNIVRDLSSVGYHPKSEIRRRIQELLDVQKQEFLAVLEGMRMEFQLADENEGDVEFVRRRAHNLAVARFNIKIGEAQESLKASDN